MKSTYTIEQKLHHQIEKRKRILALIEESNRLDNEIAKQMSSTPVEEWERIIEVIATQYQIPVLALKGQARPQHIADARQLAMFIIHENSEGSTLSEIGKYFGGRDHGTVLHACRAVKSKTETDARFRERRLDVEKQLMIVRK